MLKKKEGTIIKIFFIYLVFKSILGDYFSYNERLINGLFNKEFPKIINSGFEIIKLLLLLYIIVKVLYKKKFLKINPLILLIFFVYTLSNIFNVLSDEIEIFGSYFLKGHEKSQKVIGVDLRIALVGFVDLIFLGLTGLAIQNKKELKEKIVLAVLITAPFHIINALLQYKSLRTSWGEGALFFKTSVFGNIPMRLTGLFALTFMFGTFLNLLLIFILSKKMQVKKKFIIVIIILICEVLSLTRSSLIMSLVIIISYYFYKKNLNIKTVQKIIGIVFILFLLIFFMNIFKLDTGYFARIFQNINFKENYSLYFRMVAPITNFLELIKNDFLHFLLGLGNNNKLVSDNNFIVLLNKFGIIYLIIYLIIYIKAFSNKSRKNFLLLTLWIFSNLLFSGTGQFNNFVFILFCSLELYTKNNFNRKVKREMI